MKYKFPGVGAFRPSIGVNPNSRSTLPTTQKPVSATVMDESPVTMIPRTHSGWYSASAVNARRTRPATSQTVRSMYHRWVGTM